MSCWSFSSTYNRNFKSQLGWPWISLWNWASASICWLSKNRSFSYIRILFTFSVFSLRAYSSALSLLLTSDWVLDVLSNYILWEFRNESNIFSALSALFLSFSSYDCKRLICKSFFVSRLVSCSYYAASAVPHRCLR